MADAASLPPPADENHTQNVPLATHMLSAGELPANVHHPVVPALLSGETAQGPVCRL